MAKPSLWRLVDRLTSKRPGGLMRLEDNECESTVLKGIFWSPTLAIFLRERSEDLHRVEKCLWRTGWRLGHPIQEGQALASTKGTREMD
ncbi:hypothetical protein PM082_009736 [Marasmius tenuissimus]|nr:hypothetical protein PM082_009736 [Marasmius tenuissimus]